MKKVSRKRIVALFILMAVIIIEIIAFGLSKAQNTKEIQVSFVDTEELLGTAFSTLTAIDSGQNGYYIVLPEVIDGKVIESCALTEEILFASGSENELEEENLESVITKYPGETIYLTQDEENAAAMELAIVYDTIQVDDQKAYHKLLEASLGSVVVTVDGYMSPDSEIGISDSNIGKKIEVEILAQGTIDASATVTELFTIESDIPVSNFKVRLNVTDAQDDIERFSLIKVTEEEIASIEVVNIEELEEFTIQYNELIYEIEEHEVLAIIETPSAEVMPIDASMTGMSSQGMVGLSEDVWGGSVATGFKYGDGLSASTPFLITSGAELAYLAEQVNSGNMYAGTYFQLANNLNLNGLSWTPIGNYTNSFRGIFDGAGHNISGVRIDITAYPGNNNMVPYGLFGSIGGVTDNKAEIKNLEIDGFIIAITPTGTFSTGTAGYSIGCVTGIMYRNSKISNTIVKNSTISNTGTITKGANTSSIFVGGIAGSALNISGTIDADPGSTYRYQIENCYVSMNVSLTVTCTQANQGLYNIGGIIGHIRRQPVWPINCLYTGTITAATAMVGPIFGGLQAGTVGTSGATLNTVWCGEAAGAVAINNIYHTNYIVNGGSAFTTTETSGTSPASASRKSTSTTVNTYVQGVNKGAWVSDKSTLLNMFNASSAASNVLWNYSGGEFSLVARHTAFLDEVATGVLATIADAYNTQNYSYKWYVNGTLNEVITGDIYPVADSNGTNLFFDLVTYDGAYYFVTRAFIARTQEEEPSVDIIQWDGTTAGGFQFGTGAITDPYLITNGKELAYLATQVRSGINYGGVYFQVTEEIDLGNQNWTPIGTYNYPFRGIFDGAGHTISNATIQITGTVTAASIQSFGIFGSVGGAVLGVNGGYTEIKNVGFDNIRVVFSVTSGSVPANGGFHVGIVTGTMYRNAKIANCIVKNSTITQANTGTSAYTLNNVQAVTNVGGIAGCAIPTTGNTNGSFTDPGEGNRYAIENCYVVAEINLNITATSANGGEFSTGGIIGRIRNQQAWPENCLFAGTIRTNSSTTTAVGGFIGPIFGSVRGTTTPIGSSTANITNTYEPLFQGTDAGGGLTMTSYYTNYTALGTEFKSTHTVSGTATPINTTYRRLATTTEIRCYQGMNKGIYLGNSENGKIDMLMRFDNYAVANSYMNWSYNGGDYTFVHRHHDIITKNGAQLDVDIYDDYYTGTYSYTWYLNGASQSNITTTISVPSIRFADCEYLILTHDGTYFGTRRFIVEKTKIDVKYTRRGDELTATLVGEPGIIRRCKPCFSVVYSRADR